MVRLGVALLAASFAGNLAWLLRDPSLWVLPAALAGWYAADFASGIVHMWMDYRPCRPDLGLKELYFYEGCRESADYIRLRDVAFARLGPIERLIYDFKNHHPRPDALGRRTLMRQIGPTVLFLTLPVSLLLNLVCLLLPVAGWLVAAVAAGLLGGTFAQYFHGTLHREDNPWIVHALRGVGLLMRPEAHRTHHATLQSDFSTITGWSHPPLNWAFKALRRRGYMSDAGLEPS